MTENLMIKKKVILIVELIAFLALLQLARFGIKQLLFLAWDKTGFLDRVASFVAMAVLSLSLIFAARTKKIGLSVFPKRFGGWYIAATVIFAALLVSTPIITKSASAGELFLLFYSAVATPIFEELIFRSAVWNRLEALFCKQWQIWLITTLLFAFWHFGYVDAIALRVQSGLWNVMMWKAITGLCFGAVLGALRCKTKNSYSTMLLHGALNIFGR